MTDTGWTIEPDVVRMGIRKVTETEATVTAVMDHPNGQDYDLGCQSQLADVGRLLVASDQHPYGGYIGSTPMQPLDSSMKIMSTDAGLQWDVGAFGPHGRRLEGKTTRTLEARTWPCGDQRQRHRQYTTTINCSLSEHRRLPTTTWLPPAQSVSVGGVGSGAPKATTTDTALFIVSMTWPMTRC